MPHIAASPTAALGEVIGNGHCVAHVRQAAGLPATALWRRGPHVLTLGDDVPIGAAIATFDGNARYGNHTDGRSHAAIYMGPSGNGFMVIDQWVGRSCSHRIIRNKNGQGLAVDDASRYHLIELEG